MNKLITGRTHYYAPAAHVVMVVTIVGTPSENEIKNAIERAIHKHEILVKKIILDSNGESFYETAGKSEIQLKVREIQTEDELKLLIREQERIPFNFTNGELIRFFLLMNGEERKLVIISSHLAGDGMSVIYLIHDIMKVLGDPTIHYEQQPLILMDDFGFPKNSKLSLMMRLLLRQINQSWRKEKKVFGYEEYLSMFHQYWKDRKLELLNQTFSQTDLQKLIEYCKKYHITINSAIAAAFLIASKREKEVGMAVNVRPDGYEGMGNYASGISIQYDPFRRKPFWKNARELHRLIHKKLKKNSEKYFVLQFLKGLEPTLIDATYFRMFAGFHNKTADKVVEWFGYKDNQQVAIGISNLSRLPIPVKYGNYSIDKIEFVPPLLPNNKLVIGVVTINNKLTVTMQYDITAGDEKYKTMFEGAIKILKQEIN